MVGAMGAQPATPIITILCHTGKGTEGQMKTGQKAHEAASLAVMEGFPEGVELPQAFSRPTAFPLPFLPFLNMAVLTVLLRGPVLWETGRQGTRFILQSTSGTLVSCLPAFRCLLGPSCSSGNPSLGGV